MDPLQPAEAAGELLHELKSKGQRATTATQVQANPRLDVLTRAWYKAANPLGQMSLFLPSVKPQPQPTQ